MRVLSTSFNAFLRSPPPFPLCRQAPWLGTPDLRVSKELTAYCHQLGTWFPFPREGLCSAMGNPGLLQVLSMWSSYQGPALSALAVASVGGLICVVVTALRPEAERRRAPPCQGIANVTTTSPNMSSMARTSICWFSTALQLHMFLNKSAPGGAHYVVLEADLGSNSPVYEALSIYSSRTGMGMSLLQLQHIETFPVQTGNVNLPKNMKRHSPGQGNCGVQTMRLNLACAISMRFEAAGNAQPHQKRTNAFPEAGGGGGVSCNTEVTST
ncbi:hypothetical protein GOP47_0014266 [Adiantum capillus-veneris]|uniref:Uncharacterized protein n=1 Tax=Adiantum capillus-veneris TaxID=13818 RepID=A0A9D4ZBY8_ADICA|nr:hypothetical protein GOP47_0014266 [Adiantum capillus-veneris]